MCIIKERTRYIPVSNQNQKYSPIFPRNTIYGALLVTRFWNNWCSIAFHQYIIKLIFSIFWHGHFFLWFDVCILSSFVLFFSNTWQYTHETGLENKNIWSSCFLGASNFSIPYTDRIIKNREVHQHLFWHNTKYRKYRIHHTYSLSCNLKIRIKEQNTKSRWH